MRLKKYIVSSIVLALLLTGCGSNAAPAGTESITVEPIEEPVETKPLEEPVDNLGLEVEHTSKTESVAAETESRLVKADVADYEAADKAIRDKAETLPKDGQRLVSVETADFDGDGVLDGFAFVGNNDYDDFGESGELWFLRDGEAELFESDQYSGEQKIMEFAGVPFYVYDRAFVTGRLSYVCSVKAGKPVTEPVSGLGYVNESDGNGEFTIVPGGDYDATYDSTIEGCIGHTWKPYYFYYRDGEFHEYGGIKVTKDELSSAPGGAEALEKIEKYKINDIFYRGNGIITVNYDDSPTSGPDSYNNYYLLLEYKDGIVKEVPTEEEYGGDGIYLPSISDVAVFPPAFGK